ncbi:MAG TPA: GAF domain-containing protein [Holophagaceae bacterium]
MAKTGGQARKKVDHLAALANLLAEDSADPARLFEHGLALLMERLQAERAMLTRVAGLGQEVFWWAANDEKAMHRIFQNPEKGYCPWVMAHPERPLVVRDALAEAMWRESPAWTDLGIRAYAGVALRDGNKVIGTLCVQAGEARVFGRGALTLLKALGHLFSKTLEAEHLKQELQATKDALELSSAVVQDSALQSARSGLPNRRYLEIWLRATVFLARRRNEQMALALWTQPMEKGLKARIQAVSDALRGEDLLVELAADQYLLLMPHTAPDGAAILLARVRASLGTHPAGGTLWDPQGEDLSLRDALHRASRAMAQARTQGVPLIWQVEQAPVPSP